MVRGRSSTKGKGTQKEKKLQVALMDVVTDSKRQLEVVAGSSGVVDVGKETEEVNKRDVGDSDIEVEEIVQDEVVAAGRTGQMEEGAQVLQVLEHEH